MKLIQNLASEVGNQEKLFAFPSLVETIVKIAKRDAKTFDRRGYEDTWGAWIAAWGVLKNFVVMCPSLLFQTVSMAWYDWHDGPVFFGQS